MQGRAAVEVWVITIGVLAAVVAGLFAWPTNRKPRMTLKTVTVSVGGVSVQAELADTNELRARGLSGRQTLADGNGMLFLFSAPERPGFWMQGMKFPLDLIWVTGDRVSEITARVPLPLAGQTPPVYQPRIPVTAVLEVPAGFSQRQGVRIGDPVVW